MDNDFFEKGIVFSLVGFLVLLLISLILGNQREKEKIEVEKQKIEAIKEAETAKVVRL